MIGNHLVARTARNHAHFQCNELCPAMETADRDQTYHEYRCIELRAPNCLASVNLHNATDCANYPQVFFVWTFHSWHAKGCRNGARVESRRNQKQNAVSIESFNDHAWEEYNFQYNLFVNAEKSFDSGIITFATVSRAPIEGEGK